MTETAQNVPEDISRPAEGIQPPLEQQTGFAARAGNWAFRHKDFFQGGTGSILFKNFLRTMFAIVPYAVVNIASQHFFHKTVNSGKNVFGPLTGIFKDSNKTEHNTVTIGLSFPTFRTVSKV